MREITYPPEMLPYADADDEVEIIVCCGDDLCAANLPCSRRRTIRPAMVRAHLKAEKAE